MQILQRIYQILKYLICFIIGLFIGKLTHPTIDELTYPIIDTITIIDSFYIVNDSIVERIKYIEREYEKDTAIILSNSDSANVVYFTEYLELYNNK
jgi:hypothetical protein